MIMKIEYMFLTMLVSIALIAGCIENNKSGEVNRIIGTWKWIGEKEENTFTFYENLSFYSHYIQLLTGEEHKGWGKFYFNNTKICMYTSHGASGGEETRCYDYVFSENNKKLTLITDERLEITLIRLD